MYISVNIFIIYMYDIMLSIGDETQIQALRHAVMVKMKGSYE